MDIHRSVFLICEFQSLPMARCQFAFFNQFVDNLQAYSLWSVPYICGQGTIRTGKRVGFIWNYFYRTEEITRKENNRCYNLHKTAGINDMEARVRL